MVAWIAAAPAGPVIAVRAASGSSGWPTAMAARWMLIARLVLTMSWSMA